MENTRIIRVLRDLPISRKLTLIIALTSAVTLLVASAALILYDREAGRRSVTQEMSILGSVIAGRSLSALVFNDKHLAQQNLESLEVAPSIVEACTYQESGQVVAHYARAPLSPASCPDITTDLGQRLESDALELFAPVTLEGQQVGVVYIRSDLSAVDARSRRHIAMLGLIVLLATASGIPLARRMQRVISGPISHLADASREVARKRDYSVRVVKESEDELGLLVDSFNQMLATIEEQNLALIESKSDLEVLVSERTRDLEVANRELEAFCYSVSHDLRAPLRAIAGFAQALNEDARDRLDEGSTAHLDRIQNAAVRMGQMIEELLQLSRVTRAELQRQSIDLSGLAREIAGELLASDPKREAEFRIPDGVRDIGDPTLIRILLQNLLENAWKFTGREPKAVIEFGVTSEAPHPRYFVRDNGAGFDMRYADKLFAAFTRLHGPREFEGNGIGLATVQRVVHRHGGRVSAEGEIDRGATFFFTLGHDLPEDSA